MLVTTTAVDPSVKTQRNTERILTPLSCNGGEVKILRVLGIYGLVAIIQ